MYRSLAEELRRPVQIPVATGLRRLSQKSEKGQNRAMKTMIFLVPRLRLIGANFVLSRM